MSKLGKVLAVYACAGLTAIVVLLFMALGKLDALSWQTRRLSQLVTEQSRDLSGLATVGGAHNLRSFGDEGIPVYLVREPSR